MKKISSIALLAALAFSANAAPPKPIMWKVSDRDNSVYLLGSFHLLKEDDYPLSASVDAAFADAETLYFEISPEEMNDQAKASQLMLKLGLNESGSTLASKLKPETLAKLEKYTQTNQMPMASLQAMKPWLAGMILSVTQLQKAGLKSELGLDKHFMDLAAAAKKPGKGFETMESQFQVFNSMTADQQDDFLSQTLDDMEDSNGMVDKLHSQWRNAQDKVLLNTMVADMKKHMPSLYATLNTNRNKAWVPQIKSFLDDNQQDDALVVVGSMHLLGNDGIVQMLKKEGFEVERLK